MTDIMGSQAAKIVATISAASAAQSSAYQPLYTTVVKTTELTRAAEEHTRGKQHVRGKKIVRKRFDLLLDTGTFEKAGRFQGGSIADSNAGAAVITGFGQVYGRKVAVCAQNFSIRGDILGTTEGEKIHRSMDMAINLKVPIAAIVGPGGTRIQEGVATLTQHGRIFRKACKVSGFMPRLSLILGPCTGGAVYCPALTDPITMTRENSNTFVIGPSVAKVSAGGTISMADLGSGKVHNRVSGVTHYLGEDESDAIDCAHTALAYLPSSSESKSPVYAYTATCARHEAAKRPAIIVPTNERRPYGTLEVIRRIIDYGGFVQVQELLDASALVSFACIDGKPVGIIANQSNVFAGILGADSSGKVARFIRPCDTLSLPMVVLMDMLSYKPGSDQKHTGITRRGAKVIYAYVNAQVPMVTVVSRKAFGGAYIVVEFKAVGAGLNFVWSSSQITVLGAVGAVDIIHHHSLTKAETSGQDVDASRAKYIKEYEISTVNVNLSLETGQIDGMVDPEQTREVIVESLVTLATKQRVKRTTKYHGNQPL